MGLLQAMQWAQSMQLTNVVFELDAKTVVDGIHSSNEDFFEFGSILFECKRILNLNPTFGVEYLRMQANVVAHSLAKVATFWSSFQIFYYLPSCISPNYAII